MDTNQLEDKVGALLPSQRSFIFSPNIYSVIAGGRGSGKSHSLILKGLILSAAIPGNVGLIGRFNATDLEDSTMALFWDLCPPNWIKKYNKTRKVVTFQNNSQILFRHINDPNPSRKHTASMNIGWFGIDQMEEIQAEHWNTLVGGLRLPRAKKRFAFGAVNPAGKDWIYKRFFQPVWDQANPISEYVKLYHNGNYLGIQVKSEENRISNGGYVEDEIFARWRNEMPAEWVARYLDCSFEDFTGRIYKEYGLSSVHNIKSFPVPTHWGTVVGIDVGGDAPWAVGVWRVDEMRNLVLTKEFFKPSVNAAEVAGWIKANTSWQGSDFTAIIDPENKLAMLELAEHGIYCRPAHKGQNSVKPGIIKTGGYVHVNPSLKLPQWYLDTQPKERIKRFETLGSPRIFAMDELCPNWAREMDIYHWDEKRPDKPKKQDDHHPDQTRYVVDYAPEASRLKVEESPELAKLKEIQPAAYEEWKAFDERMKARQMRKGGMGMMVELSQETTEQFDRNYRPSNPDSRFDWGDN